MGLDWKQILPIPIIDTIEAQYAVTIIEKQWYKN